MKERTICITTPDSRTYYKAVPLAKEFLDKERNIINTAGKLPEGELDEFIVTSKTVKNLTEGKLSGKLEVIDLENNVVSFSETYRDGVLMDITENTIPPSGETINAAEKKPVLPQYEGTIIKRTKDSNSFYLNGREVAEETLGANGQSMELLGIIPDGPAREFDDNGQVRTESAYLNNKLNGTVKRFNEEGALVAEENYVNGTLQGQATYYQPIHDQFMKTVVFYRNGQLEGERIVYFLHGGICLRETYANGKANGPRLLFYTNGMVNAESHFTDGKLDGERKLYFANGSLWYKETYKNGRLDGERFSYFPNGNPRLEELYADGLLEGIRKIYAENGTLLTTEEYHWGTLLHNTERK